MTELKRNELEAMRVLWQRGPLKPAEIQSCFSWSIDNGTLRSVLAVLMEKGHVLRRKKGKAYFYRAKSSRRSLQSRMTRLMADVFTGGSTADLIAQLIKSEKLSPSEFDELRRIAENKVPTSSNRTKGGTDK